MGGVARGLDQGPASQGRVPEARRSQDGDHAGGFGEEGG